MPPWSHRGSPRPEPAPFRRATPFSSHAAGVLVLGLVLLASGYEVYLRWHGRHAPVAPEVARKLQALARVRALTDGPGSQARACLPFNRQAEARMILDDLVGQAERLTEADFAALDGARRTFADPVRGRDPGQHRQDALAFLAECRRVSERH